MASLGFATKYVFRESFSKSLSTKPRSPSEVQGIRFPASMQFVPHLLTPSLSNGRAHWRAFANARLFVERSAETAASDVVHVACARAFPELVDSEKIAVPAALGGDEGGFQEHCMKLLKRSGVADLRAREAFSISGNITEANVERLVESLVRDEGQNMEDYRQRAIMFGRIANYLSQGRAYSIRQEESWAGATEIAKSMQVIVDVVLAEDGRSATDYNCRAQLFTKSAEVFPFKTEVRTR